MNSVAFVCIAAAAFCLLTGFYYAPRYLDSTNYQAPLLVGILFALIAIALREAR